VGLPTDGNNGVVFARALEEAVESDQFIANAEASKPERKSDTTGIVAPILLTLEFDPEIGEEQANGYIHQRLPDILSGVSSRAISHIKYSSNQTPNYKLTPKQGQGLAAEIMVEGIPRYPAQLYEAISSFLLFAFLLYLWSRKKAETPEGLIFSLFLIILFGLRFVYEFFKENQETFEDNIPLNMGQWLSIPLIIAGVILIFRITKKQKDHGTGS
jgi:hypothetical protein